MCDFIMTKSKQIGMSLVELMIGLAMSSFLILAIFTFYNRFMQTSQTVLASNQINQTALIAFNAISADLGSIGRMGCLNLDNIEYQYYQTPARPIPEDVKANPMYTFNNIAADDWHPGHNWTGINALNDVRTPSAGNDVLAFNFFEQYEGKYLAEYIADGDLNFVMTEEIPVIKNDLIAFSNCHAGSVFRVIDTKYDNSVDKFYIQITGSNSGGYSNDQGTLDIARASLIFESDADLNGMDYVETNAFYMRQLVYFVGIRDNDNPSRKKYALFKYTPSIGVEEVVSNIEHMQIRYGLIEVVNTDQHYVDYVDNVPAADRHRIGSIKIGFIVSSEAIAKEHEVASLELFDQVYNLNADNEFVTTAITPIPDGRVRQAITYTIDLKNKQASSL